MGSDVGSITEQESKPKTLFSELVFTSGCYLS